MYIHCMYYGKDLAALPNGPAHQLRRDALPATGCRPFDDSCKFHSTMTFPLKR